MLIFKADMNKPIFALFLVNQSRKLNKNRRVAGPLYNDRAAQSKRKCAIMRNQAQSGAIKCAVLIFDDRALIAH